MHMHNTGTNAHYNAVSPFESKLAAVIDRGQRVDSFHYYFTARRHFAGFLHFLQYQSIQYSIEAFGFPRPVRARL